MTQDWKNGLNLRDAIAVDHGAYCGEVKRSHDGRDESWDLEFPLPFGDRLVYRIVYSGVEYTPPSTIEHGRNGLGTSHETFAASVVFGPTKSMHRAIFSADGTLGVPPKPYAVSDPLTVALSDYIASEAEEIIIEERAQ